VNSTGKSSQLEHKEKIETVRKKFKKLRKLRSDIRKHDVRLAVIKSAPFRNGMRGSTPLVTQTTFNEISRRMFKIKKYF